MTRSRLEIRPYRLVITRQPSGSTATPFIRTMSQLCFFSSGQLLISTCHSMARLCATTPQPLILTASICKATCTCKSLLLTGKPSMCHAKLSISAIGALPVLPFLPLKPGASCRGRLLRSTCDFSAAQDDFEKLLELKPSHKGAAKVLSMLQHALASRCVTLL